MFKPLNVQFNVTLFRVVKVGSIGLPNQITKIPSEYVILEQFREIHVIISRRGLDW